MRDWEDGNKKMGLIHKINGIDAKAKIVVVTDGRRDVKYVDMSQYNNVYELLQQEIRNTAGINRPIEIIASYQGQKIRVKSH